MTTETEHETHCLICFDIRQCAKEKSLRKDRPEESIQCPIIPCRFLCNDKLKFHECKQEEHELLCPRKTVPCINKEYGCPLKMERRNQALHLGSCPASVVVCTVEWNRKPLPPWQVQPFPFNPEHLDVAATKRDEKTIAEFKELLPTSLKSLLQTNNKKQPIMPLGVSGHRIPNSILVQTNREKEALGPDGVNDDLDDEDFSFSETPGGSKKSPPGLQESVCNKLKELSLSTSGFRATTPPKSPSSKSTVTVENPNSDIISSTGNGLLEPSNPDSLEKPKYSKKKPDDLSLIVDVTAKGACKYMNLYTFMCAREFRRDEYPKHFKSIHNEIMTQLNGWLFTRCPLANYGCSFGVDRMFPSYSPKSGADEYKVVYNSDLGSFCFTQKSDPTSELTREFDTSLCDLPFEVLVLLTSYLDPLSLNSLSMTNTLLRSVCQDVVMERGIVVFDWERSLESGKWDVIGKKWIFSTAFSPTKFWTFADVGVVANHMQICSHFEELRHRPEKPFCYPVSEDQL